MSCDKVNLHGIVRLSLERQEVERVASEAPGVSKVENQISIAAQDSTSMVRVFAATGVEESSPSR
jgi:hypothetical protein